MKQLSDYINKEILLIQPNWLKFRYELRSGDELLAIMHYPRILSMRAIVEGEFTGNLELYHPVFFKLDVAVRQLNYEIPIAYYRSKFMKTEGIVELQNGERLILKSYFLKDEIDVLDESRNNLINMKILSSVVKMKVKFTIIKKSELVDKNPWLPFLMFFIKNPH